MIVCPKCNASFDQLIPASGKTEAFKGVFMVKHYCCPYCHHIIDSKTKSYSNYIPEKEKKKNDKR